MTLNIPNPPPVLVNGEDLLKTEGFIGLGSTVRCDSRPGNNVKNPLRKARNALGMFNKVWSSHKYSTKTKLKLYQRCIRSILLYGSEFYRITASDLNLSVFHLNSPRRILRIFRLDTISNEQLFARCRQDSMETIIMRRRWRWIGHVPRKEPGNITRTALQWTPERKRKRGRPNNTWRRTVEVEMKTLSHIWGTIRKLAKNRQEWRTVVAALHDSGRCGQLVSVTQKSFLLNSYFPITTSSLLLCLLLNCRWHKVSKEMFNTNKNPNVL